MNDRHVPLSVFRRPPEAVAVPLPLEQEARAVTASRVLAAMAMAALVAFFVVGLGGPQQAKSSVEQAPPQRSAWIEAARQNGAFAIASSALQGLEHTYLTRRHATGGGREDILTYGAASDTNGAFVRVSLYRPGTEGAVLSDPVESVASLAALSSIQADITGPAGILITKFGDLQTVQMTLATGNGPRNCLAIAGKFDEAALGITAWYCNPGTELVAPGQLACMLDRLAMLSSGGDERLIDFFAVAERNRSFCDVKNPLLGVAPKAPDWIDTKDGPRLRGKFTAR